MYIQRNIEARSCNHSCGGKVTSINIFREFVFAALGIRHKTRLRQTLSNKRQDIKRVIEHKICVLIVYTALSQHLSF
jgi:hypothetical protein